MRDFFQSSDVPTVSIKLQDFVETSVSLELRREDLLHPEISGNKFRKLKYNLMQARKSAFNQLLTFGGAFSNHISAVAAAGKEFGFKTIGIIRGEELAHQPLNSTLQVAESCGMKLHFISRSAYRLKENDEFIKELKSRFGDFYLLPEGGTNAAAVKGCKEILNNEDAKYDAVCVAVGTGGTMAGVLEASEIHQQIIGFSVLNGIFQKKEIEKYTSKTNFQLTDAYSFGGYGKIDLKLIRFINEFKEKTGIALDPIYTGKLIYGVLDLIKTNYFKENSRILALHSGGLQGIAGINEILLRKKLPLIE